MEWFRWNFDSSREVSQFVWEREQENGSSPSYWNAWHKVPLSQSLSIWTCTGWILIKRDKLKKCIFLRARWDNLFEREREGGTERDRSRKKELLSEDYTSHFNRREESHFASFSLSCTRIGSLPSNWNGWCSTHLTILCLSLLSLWSFFKKGQAIHFWTISLLP